ncbi:hypothetical protein PABG_03544 [Paracoccidioides brasiliensis Pb03]|nr:hypothetical protein PABG_03544 [Paracoccidioides brasiliensis Pb03]
MADQGSGNNMGDKIKAATQPGDSKTTTQKLSEMVQQGVESAKQTDGGAAEAAKNTASKVSGAIGDGGKHTYPKTNDAFLLM